MHLTFSNPRSSHLSRPITFDLHSLQYFSTQIDHKLYISPSTTKLYQQHLILTPCINSFEKQLEIYEWRKQQGENVSKVEYVEQLNEDGVVREMKVFVERTEKLVKRSRKFEWRRGVEVLKSCLRGFERLYRRFGLVSVSDLMIGFDNNDVPKVWINSNFARNTCIYYGNYEKDRKNEEGRMVRSVFEAIEPYIQKNPMLIKLRQAIQSIRSFAATYSNIEMILLQQRTSRDISQSKSQNGQRKYFCKTPQNILKINYKKQQSQEMKSSYNSQQQNSYKFIPNKPNCLVFKNDAVGRRRDGKKFSSSKDKRLTGITSKNIIGTMMSLKDRDMSLTPHKKSMINFSGTGLSTKRHYFGPNKQITPPKTGEKSKERITIKQSWSSNDLSFRSQKKTRTQVHQSTLKPFNLLDRFATKRTGSTFNRSPSPLTHNLQQKFQSSEFFAPIAKSMTMIKKQLQILNNLKTKNYTKESTSDLQQSHLQEQTRSRRQSRLNEFPNLRLINQSIIQNPTQQSPSKSPNTIQRKTSLFNKIDDLKQSQVIAQINQQYSSKIDSQSPRLPPKQPKVLKKLSSKPLTQSITFQKPKSETDILAVVEYVPTALDRFARFRTESRVHEHGMVNREGVIVAINEMYQDEL